jgi:hypothetical protein
VIDEKPPLAEAYLEHFGVKGMRWGVRKDESAGIHRFQASGPVIDSKLPKSTQKAGKDVAALMSERYGFQVTALKSFGPGHPEYEMGTAAYVEATPGQRGGVIYASQKNLGPMLKHAENIGWSAKGCGTEYGLLTHESSHALFHAEEETKMGLFRSRVTGGNIDARDVALRASVTEAAKAGIPNTQFLNSVSGYAAKAGTRQEMEAELFSQYHWSPNPPPFVKVWGETLHREMGVDATPFREVVKRG